MPADTRDMEQRRAELSLEIAKLSLEIARLGRRVMREMRPKLTAQRLRELLEYDPETGVFKWRIAKRGPARRGSQAGSVARDGYVLIGVDGRRYLAHRLAWLHVHGEWPRYEIDHVNGDRADNRLPNLRVATLRVNRSNRRPAQRNSATGVRGVDYLADRRQYRVRIGINGKRVHGGYHDTLEEAADAAIELRKKLYRPPGRTGGDEDRPRAQRRHRLLP